MTTVVKQVNVTVFFKVTVFIDVLSELKVINPTTGRRSNIN